MSQTKSDQVRPFKFMNLNRNGKIARLPKALREELNRRLDNGEPARQLLPWLNSLPAVRALLAAEFGGLPVNKQSLSQWRRGGYAEWLRQQEAQALARQICVETADTQPAGAPLLTDRMAVWVTSRYLLAARHLAGTTGPEADWKALREFCHDLVALRRGDHSAARLQIAQARPPRPRAETPKRPVALPPPEGVEP